MPSETGSLDRVFHCLSSPARRKVIEELSDGPDTMAELAKRFDMSLPSFLQHLQVLESAGIVSSVKRGRVRTYELQPVPIQMAEDWLDRQRRLWASRLDQLDLLLHRIDKEANP